MPSLRRTASQSATSSPKYPTFLATNTIGKRASPRATRLFQGHDHRRSSDSQTSTRRVLAEIDWWRVVDGQYDLVQNQEQDDDQEQDQANESTHSILVLDAISAGASVLTLNFDSDSVDEAQPASLSDAVTQGTKSEPSVTSTSVSVEPSQSQDLSTTELSTPPTSPRTPIRRHHTQPSLSFSSGSSTPEISTPKMEADSRFNMSKFDFGADFAIPEWSPSVFESETTKDGSLLFSESLELSEINSYDDSFGQYSDFAISPFSDPYSY